MTTKILWTSILAKKGPAGTNVRSGLTLNFVWLGRFGSNQAEPLPFWINWRVQWLVILIISDSAKISGTEKLTGFKQFQTDLIYFPTSSLLKSATEKWFQLPVSGCLFCRSFWMMGIEIKRFKVRTSSGQRVAWLESGNFWACKFTLYYW